MLAEIVDDRRRISTSGRQANMCFRSDAANEERSVGGWRGRNARLTRTNISSSLGVSSPDDTAQTNDF